MLLFLLSAALMAQTPAPISVKVGSQELSYFHEAGAANAPILFYLPAQPNSTQEWNTWKQITSTNQWHLLMPQTPLAGDPGIKAIEAMSEDLRKRASLEKSPLYLVGGGALTPMVIYAVARAPYLFTSALAIGGSAKPAIDTDRIFAMNTNLTPVIWAMTAEERADNSASTNKLISGGYNVKILEAPTIQKALEELAKHHFTPLPEKIDCETGNPQLARCYWLLATEFDPAFRNDALRTTRIAPDSQASLDFGGFGYQTNTPGPGVVVEFLPQGYSGPLKLKDRILALSGRPIADAKHYVELMSQVSEEKPVAVTIERDKEKIRLVTRYTLKKREEVITARIQGELAKDAKDIVIVSRTVASLQLTIPPEWAPATVNWNGNQVSNPQNAGCYILSLKQPGAIRPCPSKSVNP